jgi:glycosyltransferase involved in cell wall biosynthesis
MSKYNVNRQFVPTSLKVSVCITILNEEKSISKLIESLLKQSKKADEIIIVDGGSSDKTVEIIRHLQKKDKRIKLIIQKCTRSEGRNISIDLAKNDIIATTDADCTTDVNWLKNLTEPFKYKDVDISAGFYTMKADNDFLKASSFFLGVVPSKFDENFLPSTRSMAFRKRAWEKIGGFPESGNNSSEDTDFNNKALEAGMKYARVKDARVEWRIPQTFKGFTNKIYNYAKWDAAYGEWWHPQKRFMSHNMKSLYKLIRYLLGIILFFLGFFIHIYWIILLSGIVIYSYWAFRKVYKEFGVFKIGLWGIFFQYVTDFAVIKGFINGYVNKFKI